MRRPAALLTLQRHLRTSDHYSGLYFLRSDDLGATWTKPVLPPELDWRKESDRVDVAVADVTPSWHAPTGKVLAIGAEVRYSKQGQQLDDKPRAHQTAYAVFDPKKEKWTAWKRLEMPRDDKFDFARSACAQWLVQGDGTLLLPFYFGRNAKGPWSVTVVQCSFDGQDRVWTFDDAQELGSYNTQQHWLVHSDGLFLAYTRRGANNDHIFRHRAPLFLAQVDPTKLRVLRETEKVLLPERGATLGNFGATAVTPNESWVTDAEGVWDDAARKRGAKGATFVARVLWSRPNRLVPAAR